MLNFNRDSVQFQDGKEGGGNFVKGLDINGPPGLPRPFLVKKGGMGDVILDSSDSEEEVDDDELNFARLESDHGSRQSSEKSAGVDDIGDFGDN